jgi:hypothetical protein
MARDQVHDDSDSVAEIDDLLDLDVEVIAKANRLFVEAANGRCPLERADSPRRYETASGA